MGNTKVSAISYDELNAGLNIWTDDHKVDFDADKQAATQYFLQHINPHTQFFHSLSEKLDFLFTNEYYEKEIWDQYSFEAVKSLYKYVYSFNFRFPAYLSAKKFYEQYALKDFTGTTWLERFEDRVVANALLLGQGNFELAWDIAKEIITGRLQPATPTFSNAGKKQRGEYVSCFLLRIEDNMESIARAGTSLLQLSKRGGGVSLLLSNIREAGAPIKQIEGQSSGIIPVMKMLETQVRYANQLGTRDGAASVYLSVHHPDIEKFLDTKRENAAEAVRINGLSTGVVMSDIIFHLAKKKEPMYLFSPYDVQKVYGVPFADISVDEKYYEMVNDSRIKKYKINPQELLTKIAQMQFESGYPYILFEGNANKDNAIAGRINMSNLCTEILQVNQPGTFNRDLSYADEGADISCNLAALNIAKVLEGGNIAHTVETAVRGLTAVSDLSNIQEVPSVRRGNEKSHSIGLGQMNLHGFFIKEGISYGSPESVDFTNIYYMTVMYHALYTSMELAIEKGESFYGFEKSKYANASYLTERYTPADMTVPSESTLALFKKYGIDQQIPTARHWKMLAQEIAENGLYNAYLTTTPPTGSISYVNYSTSSIHPVTAAVETRKEGKTGRVYYPQPYVTNENFADVEDAYKISNEKIIDVYAAAQKHVDQGLSLTLFYKNTDTTRDIIKTQIYAWKRGIKTLYYARIRSADLVGTEQAECVSCTL